LILVLFKKIRISIISYVLGNRNYILKTKRHIVRTSWMLAKETLQLFKIVQGNIPDNEPQILFVGGCVRDALLDIAVEDIDIATKLSPEIISEILTRAGVRVIPTGIDHGTVTAVIGDYSYEITTLRHDIKTDGRHATISYTDCWIEDAKRRDFTVNTLLMDLKGNIYDPLERGIADIDALKIRFVGKADKRIKEDYLRILRFFRFSAIYGAGEFDSEGLLACQKYSSNIKNLSKERITQEFFKIIASDKPYDVLNIMFEHGVLKEFEFTNNELLENLCWFQSRYNLRSLSSRLFVMADMNFENIKFMGEYILFPKVFLKDIKAVSGALSLPDLNCDAAVHEAVYRFGRVATAQSLMIGLAQNRVMNSYAPKALDIVQNWDIPNFPVSGADLIARGMLPSPEMGAELKRLEDEWIKGGFAE